MIEIACPAKKAYGSRAVGLIPANTDIKFDMKLVAIESALDWIETHFIFFKSI